jgi:hypothetical protein
MRSDRRAPPRESAFLNVPYDARYEDLLLAFLAGLSGFALTPRVTLEIPGSQRRLDRIVHLLRRCRYSFHDLSRVELDPTHPATPRFNMPFELGLAVAVAKMRHGRHQWFVFEARPHRTWKSLSDLAGTDEYLHAGTPRGVLHALTNALVRRRRQPAAEELEAIYRDVRGFAVEFKRRFRTRSLFEARAFRELGVAARRSASRRLLGGGARSPAAAKPHRPLASGARRRGGAGRRRRGRRGSPARVGRRSGIP